MSHPQYQQDQACPDPQERADLAGAAADPSAHGAGYETTEPATGYSATFTVTERQELDARLDREADAAIAVAGRLGAGVVVTRHDSRTFTVELSPEVPAGVIFERDLFD